MCFVLARVHLPADSGSSEASEYVGTSSRPSLPNLKPQELNHLDSSASDNSLIQKPATPSSGISPLQKRLGVGPSEIRSTSPSLHIADDSTPAVSYLFVSSTPSSYLLFLAPFYIMWK